MHSPQWRDEDNRSAFIGLDLGTSGLKGLAVSLDGQVLARGHASYVTHRPQPGASEQEPNEWLTAVASVIAQLAEQCSVETWASIGLSGMIPTLVCLDEHKNPVGRSITWEDGRADDFGNALREAFGAQELYELTGQWVDGRYLLPMWSRLRSVEPERIASTRTLAGAKDFVFASLTNVVATDPSTATGFGCYQLADGQWNSQAMLLAGCEVALPAVYPSTHVEPLTEAAAKLLGLPSGMPVCLGAADSVLGAMGMGVTESGSIAYVAGTSTVILGVTDSAPVDPLHRFIVTPMAREGSWGVEMDLLSTGGAIRWFSAMLGQADEAQALLLAEHSTGENLPTFLPYVAPGEQGALWDPTLTGTIIGLELGHSAGDLMRSLINGIVLESMRCTDVLSDMGFPEGNLRVAGGSALNPWFRQQLADATGREVVAPVDGDSDYSALGAAMIAAISLGQEIASAQQATTMIEPASAQRSVWRERFVTHEKVRRASISVRN